MDWLTPSEGCKGQKEASGTQEFESLALPFRSPPFWLPSPGSWAHLIPDEHRPHVEAGTGVVRNPVPVHVHQPADALEQLDLIKALGGILMLRGPVWPLPHPTPTSSQLPGAPHREAEAQG